MEHGRFTLSDIQAKRVCERFCRKFAFETICAMVSPDDPPCIERESDDGDQLQGGPFPTRCYSHGRALVCGVSLELSACRRTPGGARGGGGSRDYPALGGEVQSRVGGSVSSPEAPGVGQLAHGRDLYQGQRPVALSVSGGG